MEVIQHQPLRFLPVNTSHNIIPFHLTKNKYVIIWIPHVENVIISLAKLQWTMPVLYLRINIPVLLMSIQQRNVAEKLIKVDDSLRHIKVFLFLIFDN